MGDGWREQVEVAAGVIVAVLSVVGLSVRDLRAWFLRQGRRALVWRRNDGRYESIERRIDDILRMMEDVVYEVRPNGGGSIKDSINRMEQRQKEMVARENHRFSLLGYPAFECCGLGINLRVTNAYLILLKVARAESLDGMDWQQFIHPDDVDRYFKQFKRMSDAGSSFGASARFYDSKRRDLGRWFVEAPRLDSGIYFGRFVPECERAREIAEEHGWLLE